MRRVVAILVVLGILALMGGGLYAVCNGRGDAVQCLRDIAIIVLVLETFVVVLLLALIVLAIGRLITTIHDEITPLLRSAKRTVDTVQGTTTFVSDTLVNPIIGVAGFGAGVKGMFSAILSRRKTRRS